MNDGNVIGLVSVDLQKAFDTVHYSIRLQKLSEYGINGRIHQWFTSCLTDQSQTMDITGILSDSKRMTIGVPQGSVLGFLFFVVFVNDINSAAANPSVNLYADDTTIKTAAEDI